MTRSREPSAPTVPRPSRAAATIPERHGAYDDAYLDGLFTYCLSLMGEHDAATAALGEALAQAERRHERGRRPADPTLLRPWLYALARWACLRRLAAAKERAAPAAPRTAADDDRRRRELAALSWPEASGTTPEQREALELTVRHQLPAREVARVLRLPTQATHALVTTAAREVERTRAALAAVAAAGCPAAAALSGDDRGVLLGPGLRRELLRHVDECAACRLIARRAAVELGWPPAGAPGPARLTVLPVPRAAVHAARLAIGRARAQHAPRYDRAGFPVPEGDRAARRERMRGRAVATTVAAAAVVAPVLALVAAWRGAPDAGEPARHGGATATEEDGEYRRDPGGGAPAYENAGRAEDADEEGDTDPGGRDGGDGGEGERSQPDDRGADREPEGENRPEGERPGDEAPAPGELSVDAVPTEAGTRITLTASGGSPVSWSAAADVGWLSLSRTSGTLRPGETAVIEVTIDRAAEPPGAWQGRITVDPASTVITVEGSGPPTEPTDPPPDPPDPTTPPPDEGAPEP
ncbi:sigma-70 family RNA polymerase sigma factor [Streptomyces sp. PT12]|uniref:BACON domain-containing protein n=1 Tax=Streptomyces sp. PT12 TaxID=1510197 RepID=UPI001C67952F|nr:sigma-70 family RNA polymerase sigma factor [Streptomyces sp. PT12]